MAFDLRAFTVHLLADVLFYDEEQAAFGSVSLIEPSSGEEKYLCSFEPSEGYWLIEKATQWDTQEEDFLFKPAIEGEDHGTYESPEAAAGELLKLAEEGDLVPTFLPLYEETL